MQIERARQAWERMEADRELIPDRLRDWWGNYLHYHRDRYFDTLDRMASADKDVLEVGSVPAHLTLMMREAGFNVAGVDLAPERIQPFIDKHDLEIHRVDIETEPLPFPDGTFGTVLFTEVLEHLRINPLHTFSELGRVLKPGGQLWITTPNITPADRLAFLLGKDYQGDIVEEFRKLERLGHMGHFRLYSLGDIRRLLDATGMDVRSESHSGPLRGDGWKGLVVKALIPWRQSFRQYVNVVAERPR